MSEADQAEIAKFKQWLLVERARRDGADKDVCDMLESAIYPDGIGREQPKAEA